MKRKNLNRNALVTSIISLLLCVSMLVGTTFAWFTDEVVSGRNTIAAGNLDIELLVDGNKVNKDTVLFDNKQLWEPGVVVYENLQVANVGTLALKYQLTLDVLAENELEGHKLSEVVKVAIIDKVADNATRAEVLALAQTEGVALADFQDNGELKAGEKAEEQTFVIYWAPNDNETDNLYNANNGKETSDKQPLFIDFGVKLQATQLTHEADSFDNQYDAAAGTAFVGGAGTEADPYIINDPAQLQGISDNAGEYKYYKIADGVGTLDMNGLGNFVLNGSFDGNGAKLVNLSTSLFQQVGKSGESATMKISNLDVTAHVTNGRALVRNVLNEGETIFENVSMHGYIEGQYNIGSFYNYGTANGGTGEGANYTVTFINATSDATLVCTTGNAIGGMLGHGYQGSGKILSVNMDANSGYSGKMYTTGSATCFKVMALCSSSTYMLNGVETSRSADTYPSTKLTVSTPTKGADGYYTAPVSGVDHYVVFVNAQLTAYDENGDKIANKAGMTGNLGSKTVTDTSSKVFELFTSAEIVNGVDHAYSYALNGDKLTVYTGRTSNYASGTITLQVNQYAADGTLLAAGNLPIHTFPEP